MINRIYNLPKIDFVGGESQTLLFNLKTLKGNDYDAAGCRVGFAIIHYANKNGNPIMEKEASLMIGTGGVKSIASVTITPEDTISMYGRYIYQLTILDPYDNTDIPGQGIIDITRNIHQTFIMNE